MTSTLRKLYEKGQSVWCDNLSRGMIDGGELARLISEGVVGVTSNPTIFMKAITSGSDYDARLAELSHAGSDLMGVYEGLVIPDIQDAADLLRPVYDGTHRVDGYVSLEVSPKLAFDTEATVAEARRLFAAVDRPNVLIKVPATDEGIPAVQTLISEGLNVNVTLIFGLEMYERVMAAYLDGLRTLINNGGDPSKVASVASFFVSRVDTLVDRKLEAAKSAGAQVEHLFGEVAVANAVLAYERFSQVFNSLGDWGVVERSGARVQRPLWASTSTKNPDYPKTLYVDNLVGPHTVNTLPPATIREVLSGPALSDRITRDYDGAREVFREVAELGIDMKAVTDELLREGVQQFANSFDELLANLEQKQRTLSPAV